MYETMSRNKAKLGMNKKFWYFILCNSWTLVPKRKTKNTSLSTLVAERDILSIMRLGYVTCDLLWYWQHLAVRFLLLRHGSPSHSFDFSSIFFCILHMKEVCSCSLVEVHVRIRSCSYGGDLVRLGGLAHLGQISPSLRNSFKRIMCSYEEWASPSR